MRFESVWNTVRFSRGTVQQGRRICLHRTTAERPDAVGKAWQQGDDAVRRHEASRDDCQGPVAPARVLFLDEPSAGVDVELRRDMWAMVRRLRESGVTIILTTHYIEEAEDMADRVGVINRGELVVVEDTATLMHKLGKSSCACNCMNRLPVAGDVVALPAETQQQGR